MWRQPCNDDMVIITCAGKWKISRKYGGICGQGEGRMKRIVDKGLLLAGGLLMAGQSGRLAAPVIALLLAMTAAAYGSCVDNRRWHCVCLAGMFAVCFILPELCFFVPVLLYDCAEKKEMRLWFVCVPGLAFFYREQIIRQPFLWAADGLLIVAAILLACRTGRILYLEQEMIRLRDTSTELNLVLQEKNKNLMEKQDYEIYNATLKERNRIAREIHDNVGHVLSRSILMVGAAKTINKDPGMTAILKNLEDSLNHAMNSIRNSVHDLHDEAVNLEEVEKSLVHEFTFCSVQMVYDMTREVPREVKYCFISITKEAFANIMKHSNATKVQLILREHPGLYQLCIEDNGKDAFYDPEKSGIGIANMKERVNALGGTLQIFTDKGFRIFITIPKCG